MKTRHVAILALTAALSACGKPSKTSADDSGASGATPSETAASARPESFAQCATCHSTNKGDPNRIGPNLYGIMGTKAGDIPGYNFTPAMKSSGLTWDRATLDSFITAPQTLIPGTRMAYFGQKDAAKRKEIIDYLETLK